MKFFVFSLYFYIISLCSRRVICSLLDRELNTIPVVYSKATKHVPGVIDKTCLLFPDPGPCRGGIRQYYFKQSDMTCNSTFEWGGCQGNGNRFDSALQCERQCMSRPNSPKHRPNWCSLTFDYGYCFGAVNRWYYDPLWKVCKQTIFSGCGGNKNNFYNQDQCEAVCRFGNGWLTLSPRQGHRDIKKILIVNPMHSTNRQGKWMTKAPPTISSTVPKGDAIRKTVV